jgi:hypothetical protein
MAKRGRPSIGDKRMTGVQRNQKAKLKRFGEVTKRRVVTEAEHAERKQERRKTRKLKRLEQRLFGAALEIDAITGGTMWLTLLMGHDVVEFSKYTDDVNPHNIYRIPHHRTN